MKSRFKEDGPVLLMILSERCIHCVNFKKYELVKLEKMLSKDWKVIPHGIVFEEGSNMKINPKKYHPEIQSLIAWFPMFIVISNRSWKDHSIPLEYVILGGVYTDGLLDNTTSGISAKAEIIFQATQVAVEKLNNIEPTNDRSMKDEDKIGINSSRKSKSSNTNTNVSSRRNVSGISNVSGDSTGYLYPPTFGQGKKKFIDETSRISFEPFNVGIDSSSRQYVPDHYKIK